MIFAVVQLCCFHKEFLNVLQLCQGCVGALRENTALLAAYAIFLAILLLLEMTCGILGFIFKDWIKAQATEGFQVRFFSSSIKFVYYEKAKSIFLNVLTISVQWKNKCCLLIVDKNYFGQTKVYVGQSKIN